MPIIGKLRATQCQLERILEHFRDQQAYYYYRCKVSAIELGEGVEQLNGDGIWEKGRIFNPAWEIRWRQTKRGFDVSVLTEQSVLPSLPEGLEYSCRDNSWQIGSETPIWLWGEYRDFRDAGNGFLEVRIPKLLSYPSPIGRKWRNGDRAEIIGIHYMKSGMIQLTRFKEVRRHA